MSDVLTLNTPSLNTYHYEIYPIKADWNEAPGNYMFAGQDQNGKWMIYYVGETGNFAQRMPNHEKMLTAIIMGATHVLAHTNYSENSRMAEEAELIRWLQPPLNDKLR